jgi:hypothetical protein
MTTRVKMVGREGIRHNRKGVIVKKVNLFMGVCLGLILLTVGCGGCNEAAVRLDGAVGVSAAVALTEARVEGLVGTMEVMALTDEVKSAEWDNMADMLTRFEQSSIPLLAWFALPNGSYYTVDVGLASGNLSDRAYFPRVMAGEVVIGDLLVSKSTGVKSMMATVPVEDNGAIVGALGVSIFLEELSALTAADLELPNDMVLYAVNEDGVIALHIDPDLIMENSSALDVPDEVVSQTSTLLGWTFTLGVEE